MTTRSGMGLLGGVPFIVPNRTGDVDTRSPHWYISYNDCDTRVYGSDTTALVIGQGEYFLILNGDHRGGFNKALEYDEKTTDSGLSRCLHYVRDNRDKLNKFSDTLF
jgi:hypothetical protein